MRKARRSRRAGTDSGQVTAFVVVMAAALVLMIGLVLDGGLTLAARERALGEAQEAARAGAQAVNLATYRQDGNLVLDPAQAAAEYIGATLIGPAAAVPLASALEATWRRDPGLYYEDGYQEFTDRGEAVAVAPIGATDWVEVDNHEDLRRARDIAVHC